MDSTHKAYGGFQSCVCSYTIYAEDLPGAI